MRIKGVLRNRQCDSARRTGSTDHRARVVERLRPCVTSLQPRSAMLHAPGERGLQRVVRRVSRIGNHRLGPEPSADRARIVEGGVRRETGLGAWIGVRIRAAWQMERLRYHISRIGGKAKNRALKTQG